MLDARYRKNTDLRTITKILHYSDQSEPKLKELFQQADVLFTTGDLSSFDFIGTETELSIKPGFGVYGNHCTPGYLERLGILNVHLQVFEWHGLTIGGYQGCPRYKTGGGLQFTEEEAQRDLDNFPRVDILLLHAGPFGLLDTPGDEVHIGSKAVKNYVDRVQPKYVFCGHDSPSAELQYGNTTLFRTHQARIIEI
ncbi:MAG TPA: metallophosphoesterase [Candidatus Pacebacteria bacterium]|nr:metallophosphoesterase [Candidatus Paceibacterota bacterium]